MGLLNGLQEGFQESLNRIKSPLDKLSKDPIDVASSRTRNDFQSGVELVEFENGVEKVNERVRLLGDSMPLQPFTFGGEQKIVKDYYPGNTEPTVQVLGPRESDIVLKGVFKSKTLSPSSIIGKIPSDPLGKVAYKESKSELRQYAKEQQELVEAMRLRGNLVRFTMGAIQRFCFIEKTSFNLKTLAEIEYEITLSIIGFNPPSDCKVLGRARTVPFDINKEVVNAVNAFQETANNKPLTIPRSLSEVLDGEISKIAEVTSACTSFVNNVLTEVDSLRDSAARAIGLIKNAKAAISSFERRVGAVSPEGGFNKFDGNGVSGAYKNASYFSDSLSSIFTLAGFLSSLEVAISKLRESEPQARHKIQTGDTLQRLAGKYYNDTSLWEDIYDHNKLQSSDLETIIGDIIEIPRVD